MSDQNKIDVTTSSLLLDIAELLAELHEIVQGRGSSDEFLKHIDLFVARRKAATNSWPDA